MYEPVVIIPAYNRHVSLDRLLQSIKAASYIEQPKVIISLEGGASSEVNAVATAYQQGNENVLIIRRETRLGLRKHILACGDMSAEFGAVIILEDDLWVDKYYYTYAMEAINFYADKLDIAGIALYSPRHNEFAYLPFEPIQNGYSTYLMQTPCSWGQAWTDRQWQEFRKWYASASEETVKNNDHLPKVLREWPESSWKKYFAAYLVESNRYFVYPYLALSTNHSDSGGYHNTELTNRYQVPVPLQNRPPPQYSFCSAGEQQIMYDAHMEQCGSMIESALNLNRNEVEVDLYGIKPHALLMKKKYVLTTKTSNSHLQCFGLNSRPVDNNMLNKTITHVNGQPVLCAGSELIEKDGHNRTILEYSYFAGLNISSLHLAGRIISGIPKIMIQRFKDEVKAW